MPHIFALPSCSLGWRNFKYIYRNYRDVWETLVFTIISVAQRQINVVTTLCTSTLKFTTLNNVESTVSTMLSFSASIFTTLGNVETTLWIWSFEKKTTLIQKQNNIFKLQVKTIYSVYAGLKIFFILFLILTGICKKIFAEMQKFLKHLECTELQQLYLNYLTL